MKSEHCQLLVIGAGPSGYACGIRAGQLGVDTIVVEAAAPGGTGLNVGCIPSKALIHAADEFAKAKAFSRKNELGISVARVAIDLGKTIDWKDGIVKRLTGGVSSLLRKAKTRYVVGRAHLVDGKTVDVETADGPLRIHAQNLVIATGSKPLELPGLPFGGAVISSTEALALREVPGKLVIVGGGYIGVEIGTAMAKLGSSVTIVEGAGRILPQYDAELTAPVAARLRDLGVSVLVSTKANGLDEKTGALSLESPGGITSIEADRVLVTVGRQPATGGFGLEDLGLTMQGPYIAIDSRCATSMHGVYAIGDVTGDPMLAHRAIAQGVLVAEVIAGSPARWDKRAIPSVCFSDPEIVVVGQLPGVDAKATSATFPFSANGRAITMERNDGFVRIVFDPADDLVLGIQAVGAGVSELAAAFALAVEMGATLTDVAQTVHAHPTLGEALQETALRGVGRALHI